jgi:hypothetical protein
MALYRAGSFVAKGGVDEVIEFFDSASGVEAPLPDLLLHDTPKEIVRTKAHRR